jgi:hypothetical protein
MPTGTGGRASNTKGYIFDTVLAKSTVSPRRAMAVARHRQQPDFVSAERGRRCTQRGARFFR